MKHDRDGEKQSKKKSGNHRPSNANGKVRPKAAGNHGSKRTAPSSKGSEKTVEEALPSKRKTSLDDERLIDRARDWAHLHANPKTRDQMDKILNGLSEADKRRVRLCGQRIASGLSVKLVK